MIALIRRVIPRWLGLTLITVVGALILWWWTHSVGAIVGLVVLVAALVCVLSWWDRVRSN